MTIVTWLVLVAILAGFLISPRNTVSTHDISDAPTTTMLFAGKVFDAGANLPHLPHGDLPYAVYSKELA